TVCRKIENQDFVSDQNSKKNLTWEEHNRKELHCRYLKSELRNSQEWRHHCKRFAE
ncbi:Proteasome subunit alpha type-6, partial [Armadillidium vulgare]